MIDRKHAIRVALGVAGLISALSGAVAQEVEQYSGTKRINTPAPQAAAPRVSEIAPAQEKSPAGSQPFAPQWRSERSNEPVNTYVPPPPPPLPRKIEEPKPATPSMPLASNLPPLTPAELPVLTPASAVTAPVETTEHLVGRAADSCADAVSTKVERLGGAAPIAKAAEKGDTINFEGYELSQNDFYKIAIWQVICTVCGIVLCLFMLLGLAMYIVRKMRHGPLFSVEFVSPYGSMMGMAPMMPMAHAVGTGHHLAPATMHGQPGMPAADLGPMTAQKFDLGPSYEEEMVMKAEAEKLAQQAVLQQIMDDNVVLREKIEAGEGAAV